MSASKVKVEELDPQDERDRLVMWMRWCRERNAILEFNEDKTVTITFSLGGKRNKVLRRPSLGQAIAAARMMAVS